MRYQTALHPVYSVRERSTMLILIVAVSGLNLADAAFTLLWIQGGHATEANPLLVRLVAYPAAFTGLKVTLVSLGLLLLWRLRRHRLAQQGAALVLVLYYAVLVYHLSALR